MYIKVYYHYRQLQAFNVPLAGIHSRFSRLSDHEK